MIVQLLSSTGVVAVHGLLMPVERELVSHVNVRVGTQDRRLAAAACRVPERGVNFAGSHEVDAVWAPAVVPLRQAKAGEGLRKQDCRQRGYTTCVTPARTLLIAQGVHPRVVMEALGYSQISITMDLHSHVTSTMQAEAAAKLDAAIG